MAEKKKKSKAEIIEKVVKSILAKEPAERAKEEIRKKKLALEKKMLEVVFDEEGEEGAGYEFEGYDKDVIDLTPLDDFVTKLEPRKRVELLFRLRKVLIEVSGKKIEEEVFLEEKLPSLVKLFTNLQDIIASLNDLIKEINKD